MRQDPLRVDSATLEKGSSDEEIGQFDWTISVDSPLNLADGPVFFFWLFANPNSFPGPDDFSSGYFNITSDPSPSPSLAATSTPITSVTTSSALPSIFTTRSSVEPSMTSTASPPPSDGTNGGNSSDQVLKIGLGVGLGVGIPLVALMAACLFFSTRYLKKIADSRTAQTHQPTEQKHFSSTASEFPRANDHGNYGGESLPRDHAHGTPSELPESRQHELPAK